MANFFPRWTNILPLKVVVCGGFAAAAIVAGVTYYFTPEYTRVGYMPSQPVPFSHDIHVTQLGMDCRYCHTQVEVSGHSNVPTTQTCISCHGENKIQWESPKLEAVRNSWSTGLPIMWDRIHKAPDYAYFNHAVHVNRGVSCVSCHGNVDQMPVVYQAESQSMGWCLECHRNPEPNLRPLDEVYNLTWTPTDSGLDQASLGKELVDDWHINPPETCAGCHR